MADQGGENLGWVVRLLMTCFIGVCGLLIFANIGALAYPTPPGVGPVIFGVGGLVVFLLIGTCMTGSWRDALPQESASAIFDRQMRKTTGIDTSLLLVVTVKEVRHVNVHGRLYEAAELYLKPEIGFTMSRPELFVEIANGGNPPKATCVKKDGKFNEQFQLAIDNTDRELMITVKDQEVYGAQSVGFVSLEIDRDILFAEEGMPLTMTKKLSAGEGFTLRQNGYTQYRAEIELMFDTIGREDKRQVHERVREHGLHEDASLLANDDGDHYGATKFLSSVQYDRHNKQLHDDSAQQAISKTNNKLKKAKKMDKADSAV